MRSPSASLPAEAHRRDLRRRRRPGDQDPVRRRTGAIGSGGAINTPATSSRVGRRVQRDILTQVDLGAVIGCTGSGRRAPRSSSHRSTPDAYGLVERIRQQHRRFLEKPKPKRSRRTTSTGHLRPRARTPSIASEQCRVVDRAQLFSVARRARRNLRGVHRPRY